MNTRTPLDVKGVHLEPVWTIRILEERLIALSGVPLAVKYFKRNEDPRTAYMVRARFLMVPDPKGSFQSLFRFAETEPPPPGTSWVDWKSPGLKVLCAARQIVCLWCPELEALQITPPASAWMIQIEKSDPACADGRIYSLPPRAREGLPPWIK